MSVPAPRLSRFSRKRIVAAISLVSGVVTLALAVPAVIDWFDNNTAKTASANVISGAVTQTVTDGGSAIITQGDNTTVQVGLTIEQLRTELQAYTSEIQTAKKSAKGVQLRLLETQLAEAQRQLDNLDKTLADRNKQLQEASQALAKLKGKLPEAVIQTARAALLKGDTRKAEQAFDSVVEQQGASVALAAYESARLAESRIDYSKAIENYRVAVVLAPENTDYLNRAGMLANSIASYSEARQWLESARRQFETQGIEGDTYAAVLNNLAELYRAQGDYAKAEPLYLRDLEITEKALGDSHPSVATTLNNLAELYRTQGDYAKAEPLYTRSLRIRESALGNEHPDVGQSLNNLAGLYYSQGDYAKAEPLYLRDLEITEKALGDSHPSVATTLNNLGVLYYRLKKLDQALPLMNRAVHILEGKFPKGHPDLDTYRANYQFVLQAQKPLAQTE